MSTVDSPAATVMALTPDGGGPFATVIMDAKRSAIFVPGKEGHWEMRFPPSAPYMSDSKIAGPAPSVSVILQIIAPRHASRAKVMRGGTVIAEVRLQDGAGRVSLPPALDATVRAYDPGGHLLVEQAFRDRE